jgi:diguanylate cyclase (GGDEF)-like protein
MFPVLPHASSRDSAPPWAARDFGRPHIGISLAVQDEAHRNNRTGLIAIAEDPNQMAHPTTILVVEDDAAIRRILEYQLQKAGYSVLTAEDGETGLSMAMEHTPELVLLDVMLPCLDGHEVCRRIRQDYKISQTPIIMLTARSSVKDRVAGLAQGANDYLMKPYDQEEMLVRVKNTLTMARNQREANPLTGLPGNHAIEAELMRRLGARENFSFIYLDIDNFKGYNDTYGYAKGDSAIRLLRGVITEAIHQSKDLNGFAGHVGGDDFVLITNCDQAEPVCRRIVKAFDLMKRQLFRGDDWDRGYLTVLDRQGVEQRIPLMSLTIAIVENEDHRYTHLGQISDAAFELKSYGKTFQGSTVVKERRGGSEGEDDKGSLQTGGGSQKEPGQG